MLYFNEFDKFAASWLRNLFPAATVDERDIRDVKADDVSGFERVHFFGGIAGWELALQLAGWPDGRKIWTGSCPCQPFSSAGKRKGTADERHLWPEFLRLIAECRPATIFGEQVASKDGRAWLAGVRADMEALGYAVGAADLCAASQGAPHIRQRLFWVAVSESAGGRANVGTVRSGQTSRLRNEEGQDERRAGEQAGRIGDRGPTDGLVLTQGDGRHQGRPESNWRDVGAGGVSERLVNGAMLRREGSKAERLSLGPCQGCSAIACSDGKARRVSVEPGDEPLAHGIPNKKRDVRLGYLITRLVELGHCPRSARRTLAEARKNRITRLRGYGNAIVPQVAAEFIRAFLEVQSP